MRNARLIRRLRDSDWCCDIRALWRVIWFRCFSRLVNLGLMMLYQLKIILYYMIVFLVALATIGGVFGFIAGIFWLVFSAVTGV